MLLGTWGRVTWEEAGSDVMTSHTGVMSWGRFLVLLGKEGGGGFARELAEKECSGRHIECRGRKHGSDCWPGKIHPAQLQTAATLYAHLLGSVGSSESRKRLAHCRNSPMWCSGVKQMKVHPCPPSATPQPPVENTLTLSSYIWIFLYSKYISVGKKNPPTLFFWEKSIQLYV